MALIACVDLDPFLVDLVRRARPDDDVVVAHPEELEAGRAPRRGALVVAADSSSLTALADSPAADRTVLVAPPHVDVAGHAGPVLRRPVDAADLHVALSRVIPPPQRWSRLRSRFSQLSSTLRVDGAFTILRAAALTAAIALQAAQPTVPDALVLAMVMVAWVALRVWIRPLTEGLVTLDVVMAVAAVVATGGTSSPYLLVAGVVAGEVGYGYPARTGAVLVGAATIAGLVPLTVELAADRARAIDLVTWGTVIPLSSVAGVLAHRIQRSRDIDQLLALRQVNATLGRLARQAQAVAGSLSVATAVEEALDGLRDEVGAVAGAVLLEDEDAGVLRTVAGSFGLVGEAPGRVVGDGRRMDVVPGDLDVLFPEGHRLVVPMRVGEVDRGALVGVVPWGQRSRASTRRMEALAGETALAVDNARVFESVRQLTVDDERRRLARDLHDGVVQALVHVGFELDMLRGELADGARGEVERLRGVVGRTVDEVRATVNDLRSVRLSDGLGPALVALGREYDSEEVTVRVEVDPVGTLSPEAELQLLRIAQEAVSNAVHHGRPRTVAVRLWTDPRGLHLQVDDDGVGMGEQPASTAIERGVGLRAMNERADLLGAVLDIGPGAASGTSVRVDVPAGKGMQT